MIGVILAAGMAKRLRPLTDTQPKCLLTVGSRTLLQRTVEAMASTGITEFVVVTGYRAEMIRSFLSSLYISIFSIMPITSTTIIFIRCGWQDRLFVGRSSS